MLPSLIGVALLGFLVGGVIVAIDSLILRRIRRQREQNADDEKNRSR